MSSAELGSQNPVTVTGKTGITTAMIYNRSALNKILALVSVLRLSLQNISCGCLIRQGYRFQRKVGDLMKREMLEPGAKGRKEFE